MIKYLAQYLPNESNITATLRSLLKQDVEWSWQPEHDVAMQLVQVAGTQVVDQVAGVQVLDQLAGAQVVDQVTGVQAVDQVDGTQVMVDQVAGAQVLYQVA